MTLNVDILNASSHDHDVNGTTVPAHGVAGPVDMSQVEALKDFRRHSEHLEIVGPNGAPASQASDGVGVLRTCNGYKAQTFDPVLIGNDLAGFNLPDGEVVFVAMEVLAAVSLVGLKWLQQKQGDYTTDHSQQVGLYSSDGTTLTRVAASADDANLWKAANDDSVGGKNFAAPYTPPAPGVVYAALLYNESAHTVIPALYRAAQNGSWIANANQQGDKVRVGKLSAQNSLPASVALSALTPDGDLPFLAIV